MPQRDLKEESIIERKTLGLAIIGSGRIGSLRHFQDEAKEVKAGSECGLRLENYQDFQTGDVIECYTVEKVAASL